MTRAMAGGRRKSDADEAGRRGDVPLRQAAYDSIEALLNSGALQPGQMISQRELVEKTGCTLGAIRETVPRLEAEGLLVTVPQRGLMVPSLDVTFVRDAYQLRRMIELSAVPDMVARIPRSTLAEWIDWHRAVRAQIRAETGRNTEALSDELQRRDWAMHESFVKAMGNKLVANVYRVTAIKIRMAVQSRIRVTRNNATRVIDEHLAILEALDRGDTEATATALARHIDQSLKLALGELVG